MFSSYKTSVAEKQRPRGSKSSRFHQPIGIDSLVGYRPIPKTRGMEEIVNVSGEACCAIFRADTVELGQRSQRPFFGHWASKIARSGTKSSQFFPKRLPLFDLMLDSRAMDSNTPKMVDFLLDQSFIKSLLI